MRRRIRPHPAGIRPGIAVAGPLVIARRRQRHHRPPVRKRKHGNFAPASASLQAIHRSRRPESGSSHTIPQQPNAPTATSSHTTTPFPAASPSAFTTTPSPRHSSSAAFACCNECTTTACAVGTPCRCMNRFENTLLDSSRPPDRFGPKHRNPGIPQPIADTGCNARLPDRAPRNRSFPPAPARRSASRQSRRSPNSRHASPSPRSPAPQTSPHTTPTAQAAKKAHPHALHSQRPIFSYAIIYSILLRFDAVRGWFFETRHIRGRPRFSVLEKRYSLKSASRHPGSGGFSDAPDMTCLKELNRQWSIPTLPSLAASK